MSGSGISWAICKSAPRSRQTTTPAPHQSVFTGRMPYLPPNQQRQSTEGNPLLPPITLLIQLGCCDSISGQIQPKWNDASSNNNNNSTDWLSRQLKQPNWDNQREKKRSNTTSRTLPTCPAVLRRWTAFSPTSWALAWCVSAGSSSDMQQHRCCRHRLRPQCCWRRAENTPVEVCRIHRNCVRHKHAFYLNITKLCQVCKMACINAAPANLKRVLCLIFCLSKFNSITII